MKKILVFFSLLCFVGFVFGQLIPEDMRYGLKEISSLKMNKNHVKDNNDTIGWNTGMPKFCDPTCQIYVYSLTSEDQKIGYWFGTNYNPTGDYSLSYWAQCYLNETPVKIIGALAMIAGKVNMSSNPESKIEVSLYKMAPEQTIIGGTTGNYEKGDGPAFYQGTALGKNSMSINDLDTVWDPNLGLNYFPFAEGVYITSDFAIVSNFTSLVQNSDTAYMYCDEPGNGLGLHYAQYSRDPSQYVWLSTDFATDGLLNINIPLFAVVDLNSANINSPNFFQGMKMTIYPNPVRETTVIDYALQFDSNVSLSVIDESGRHIKTYQLGQKSPGLYSFNFDSSELTQGNYFIALQANGTRLIKLIQKIN